MYPRNLFYLIDKLGRNGKLQIGKKGNYDNVLFFVLINGVLPIHKIN